MVGHPNTRVPRRSCSSCSAALLPGDGISGEPVVRKNGVAGLLAVAPSENRGTSPWADRVAFILGYEPSVRNFRGVNVEVVVPEIHHHFLELALV